MEVAVRPFRTALFFALVARSALPLASQIAVAQQSAAVSASSKPIIEEWVYRTKCGYKDEWWGFFEKYQIAILERPKSDSVTSKNLLSTHQVFTPVKTPDGTTGSSSFAPLTPRRQGSLGTRSLSNSSRIRPRSSVKRTGAGSELPTTGISQSTLLPRSLQVGRNQTKELYDEPDPQ